VTVDGAGFAPDPLDEGGAAAPLALPDGTAAFVRTSVHAELVRWISPWNE